MAEAGAPRFRGTRKETVGLVGPLLWVLAWIWDMFRVGMVSDLLRLTALILIGPFLVGLIA